MSGTTTNHALQYPESTDSVQVAVDMKTLADDVDALLPVVSSTQPTNASGLIWQDSGTGQTTIGNGTDFNPIGPLGLVGIGTGPSLQTDCTTGSTLVTVTVPVAAGRAYRIYATLNGSQITSAGTATAFLLLGATELTRLVPLSNTFSIAANTAADANGAWVYTPTADASAVFSVKALTTAGALRVATNSCQLSVDDIGVAPS